MTFAVINPLCHPCAEIRSLNQSIPPPIRAISRIRRDFGTIILPQGSVRPGVAIVLCHDGCWSVGGVGEIAPLVSRWKCAQHAIGLGALRVQLRPV